MLLCVALLGIGLGRWKMFVWVSGNLCQCCGYRYVFLTVRMGVQNVDVVNRGDECVRRVVFIGNSICWLMIAGFDGVK